MNPRAVCERKGRSWIAPGPSVRGTVASTLFAALLLHPPAAGAQFPEPVPPPEAAARQESAGSGQDGPGGLTFRWDDHPALHYGDDTRVEFRARLQGQLRASEAPLSDGAAFDLTRRRIGLDGRIAGIVDFQIERELESDDPWRDVYLDYRQFTQVRVQAGKFKLPFSLDENTSPANLDFVHRSAAANALAPGRDRGAMVHGRVAGSVLGYELGLFQHDGRNARTNNPERVLGERTLAGRLTARPFRRAAVRPLRDLQVGAAFTRNAVPEGLASLRGRTVLDEPFITPGQWVSGLRRRTGLEARWTPGPFSVKSEHIRVTTERRGQSVEDGDLSPLLATGWYLSGTWILTGEEKADGLWKPRRPLLRGGAGAIELAARLETLTFGSTATDGPPSTSPRGDTVLANSNRITTLGVNWHPHQGIKVQINLVHERIHDPLRGPLPDKAGFWSSVVHFLFAL